MGDAAAAWLRLGDAVIIKGTGKPFKPPLSYSLLQWTVVPFIRFFIRIKPYGIERIPKQGSGIFVANHLSHVDPVVVVSVVRKKLHYLAKDEHFTTRGVSFLMKATGQIKTERESGAADALSRASDILAEGRCLGLFPEGTRSRNKEPPFLATGKTGAARLAASHPEVPVTPMALIGTREFMAPKIHKLPRLWKKIRVNIGYGRSWNQFLEQTNVSEKDIDAIAGMESDEKKAAIAALYRAFTDLIMADIKELGAP
ncbi:MAG: lysophospholipid acyltransferase family protein [Candidatus Poseidoniales archaeon]|jgi:1-acyl-sn-glycerol-3-phosphate acyltransferase